MVCAFVLTGTGALVWSLSSAWSLLSEPIWNDPQPDPALEQANRRKAELTTKYQEVLQRREAKHRIASQLIEQRLTLKGAAAQFYEIDRTVIAPDLYLQQLEFRYPGKTLDERLCRQVIEYVRVRVARQLRWRNALPRLETELQAMQRDHGGKFQFLDSSSPGASRRAKNRKSADLLGQ
jgi:hypothetical protein